MPGMMPPQGMPQGGMQGAPGEEQLDRALVEQVLMLPAEMKMQLLQTLSQGAQQAPQQAPQQQALGAVMGDAARGMR